MRPEEKSCPQEDLLSAWYDGELSSPWKEQLEKHLEECPACRARVEKLRSLSALLCDADETPADTEASREKMHRAISYHVMPFRRESWWRRQVAVPIPAAAAVVLLFFSVSFLWFARNGSSPDSRAMPVAESSIIRISPSEEDQLRELLGALEEGNSSITEVEWVLPDDTPLLIDDQSRLIREVDYQPVWGQP